MTPTLQRRFEFDLSVAETPLVGIEGLRALTGRTEDDVLYLIEDRQLSFAFDLALPGAARRELRVWRECLRRPDATLREAIDAILPAGGQPAVRISSLRLRWVCSPSHLFNLIRAGCLQEASPEGRRTTQARFVTRASAARFLEERRQ